MHLGDRLQLPARDADECIPDFPAVPPPDEIIERLHRLPLQRCIGFFEVGFKVFAFHFSDLQKPFQFLFWSLALLDR